MQVRFIGLLKCYSDNTKGTDQNDRRQDYEGIFSK